MALVAGTTACGNSTAPSADKLQWCPKVTGHVTDCGVISRPLVEGAPQLGTVDVGYALIRHSRENSPAAGTVMPNPGGPGAPTISYGTDVAALNDAVLKDYDVLLIDARGTGVSTPLDCGIDERAFEIGTRDYQRSSAVRCADKLGPKAAGYTSAATADDFDAVRAHLGIDKVIPYGSSYGTYLMTVYGQRHPEHVQSIVLAGAYPLHFDPLQRPNADAVDLTLRRICERSHSCDPDVAVRDLRTVTAQLRATPITVDKITVTEGEFGNLVFEGATSDVGSDPDELTPLGRLPAALHAAAHGDDAALRRVIADIAAPDPDSEDDDDLYVAVACNDYLTLWSADADIATREAQYHHALNATGELGSFSAEGFADAQHDGGDICIRWPKDAHHQRPDQASTPFPSAPVLVLSGDLDAITPDANGLLASRQFPHSTYLEVPNLGHTPDNEPSGCVAGIIEAFLRTGAPPSSTHCLDDIPPIKVEPVR
jgi:pimeloyl-ACP methyl ester carboxylesterase